MPVKITGPGTATNAEASPALPTKLPRTAPSAPVFAEQLASARRLLERRDLDRVLGAIEEQGRRLKDRPEPDELDRYKRLVKEFLQGVVRQAYRLKVSYTASELFHIVEEVDEELLALAQLVLARQQDVLAIASQIDRITGIVLDLAA